MSNLNLTDEQVEFEIERIRNSEAYKLGIKEMRYKNARRQLLYKLRHFEKRGKELMSKGMTLDDFDFEEVESDE